MVDLNLFTTLLAAESITNSHLLRRLQLPDYTSPPLIEALAATPTSFQNETYFDEVRNVVAAGNCSEDVSHCQMLYPPPAQSHAESDRVGVVLYGGALVDPRSYSIMAKSLSENHGLPVAIPIFPDDVAFLDCNGTDRIQFATSAFPDVEKWLLVGHSLGGIGAQVDFWNALNEQQEDDHQQHDQQDQGVKNGGTISVNTADILGGLVLAGSYIRQDTGCGAIDFSQTHIPMASVFAELDGVVNRTRFDLGQDFVSGDGSTLKMIVEGGNHGNFGHYNDTLRTPILGQTDGIATISRENQVELTIAAIVHVASRVRSKLPALLTEPVVCDTSSTSGAANGLSSTGFISFGMIALATAATISVLF